jgi:hypothetical protein
MEDIGVDAKMILTWSLRNRMRGHGQCYIGLL